LNIDRAKLNYSGALQTTLSDFNLLAVVTEQLLDEFEDPKDAFERSSNAFARPLDASERLADASERSPDALD
jgi:hypothetical protein